MAADSFWDMEYLFDYAVARGLSLLRPAVDSAPENQLVKIFRANAAVDNCLLVAAGLMFGDIYLGFWLAQQPILSLPSIVFYGSAGLAFIAWESTVTTDPGAIPESFARDDNGRPRFEADINELALVPSNGPRGLILITKEQKFKPKRSHFCRQMDRYILRMDHYCAFMSNCIGYKNHKFFYLFLFYSSMATSVEAFAIMSQIWQVHPVAQILLLPGATLSGFLSAFSLSYCGFHSYLMCKNLTMVEFAYPKKRRQAYDEGLCRNLAQVLGDCWLFWLSPFTGPDGTGVEWGIEEEDVPEDSTKFLQTSMHLSLNGSHPGTSLT